MDIYVYLTQSLEFRTNEPIQEPHTTVEPKPNRPYKYVDGLICAAVQPPCQFVGKKANEALCPARASCHFSQYNVLLVGLV